MHSDWQRESEKSGKEVAGSGSAGRRESLTRSLDHREKEDGGRRERGRHSQTAAGGLNIKKGRGSVPSLGDEGHPRGPEGVEGDLEL